MGDMMTFPDTVEEFMEQYKVVDTDGIYMSKDSGLVPIFRMKQWFEHLPSAQPEITPDGTLKVTADADIEAVGRILLTQVGTQRGGLYYKDEQPEIIRCRDCKHNPKLEWFGCPMSHLNEKQRHETAWCWKGERRTDEQTD